MITFRNIVNITQAIKFQPKVIATFSSDKWKERDDAQ